MHVNNQPMIVLLVLFTEEEEEKREGHIMEGVGGITANLFCLVPVSLLLSFCIYHVALF